MQPVPLPRHHRNREVRTREHLTPTEVERLRKAARSVGRHGLRNDTIILLAYWITLSKQICLLSYGSALLPERLW